MNIRFLTLAVTTVGLLAGGQMLLAQQQEQHEQHHPPAAATPAPPPATPAAAQANMMKMMGQMKAADPKLDALVKKMNAATGAAKTDAIAELLTALVEDRRNTCEPMMANMMSMMNMMGSGAQHGDANPKK